MSYDRLDIIIRLVAVLLVIVSASLHEFGHALAAHLCGDDTAKEAGRLTINPLAHIDPMGSVILPLICTLSGLGYIAYAKPVPYNPYRLRNPRRDDALVAVAGPLANLAQALAGAVLFHLALLAAYGSATATQAYLYDALAPTLGPGTIVGWTILVLRLYVQVNCSLAFFNLLPIPPLDGSKLIIPLLRGQALQTYYQIQRYALPVTLALVWLLPRYTGIDPVGAWLDLTAGNLAGLLIGGW